MDFGVFYELIFEVFNLKLENYFDAACWPTFTPATMFECYFLRLPVRATLSALPNFPTFRNGPPPPPPSSSTTRSSALSVPRVGLLRHLSL